jgi:hypothetical protein
MPLDWSKILPKPPIKDPEPIKPIVAPTAQPIKKREPILTYEDARRYLALSAKAREEKKHG